MELLNFKINCHYSGLYYNDFEFDLHNCSDFYSLKYIVEARELYLSWKSNEYNSYDFKYIATLKFSNVNNFKVTKRDNVYPFESDSHLLYINLIPNTLRDDETYLDDFTSYTDDRALEMLLTFNSNQNIRVSAESVELILEKLD